MTEGEVIRGLEAVRSQFGRILESEATQVLEQARVAVRATKREHDERVRQGRKEYPVKPWGYQISDEMPLRFKDTIVDDFWLRVDVLCEALWLGEDEEPCSQRLAVRVWSLDDHVMFREDWDAPGINARIHPEYGRVMLRFHFDRAGPGQQGPKYHVQVGGKAHPEECCWLHEGVSIPRLAYPPMDLVLACEMIAANFFLDEYRRIRSDPLWTGVVRASQEYLLRPYHSICTDVLAGRRQNVSMLDELWNTSWA